MKNLLTFNSVCKALSISDATLNNWIRLNKISYIYQDGKYFFEKSNIENIAENSDFLKSRRNKTFKKGNIVCKGYIENSETNISSVKTMIETFSDFNETEIRLILSTISVKLLAKAKKINIKIDENLFENCLSSKIELGIYQDFINDIAGETQEIFSEEKVKFCLALPVEFNKFEDFLGFLYMSLKNVAKRKSNGMYYTPSKMTEKSIENFKGELSSKTILDPCCGSGNFLLEVLKNNCKTENIYGCDNDFLSVAIARFNIALNCDETLKNIYDLTCKNIVFCDFLSRKFDFSPDIIVGNPPWGYNFSKEEKKKLSKNFVCAKNKSFDSFDIFTEKSLSLLNENGVFSFILPQSVTNVKMHEPLRQIITQNFSFLYVGFFKKAFDGVICPSVILTLKKQRQKQLNCVFENDFEKCTLSKNRKAGFEFLINISDEEYALIEKICCSNNVFYLKDKCKFALGIVTGNNKKFISNEEKDGFEPILKGSDIERFSYKTPTNFIEFKKDSFQQVAGEDLYRANEKIIYSFIGNEPKFAYDNGQILTLNSCNIIVSDCDKVNIKYILAVLNSKLAKFYFKKRFNSLKLLRSHIESLPILNADENEQNEIANIVDNILNNGSNKENLIKKLNEKIFKIYGLSNEEINLIKN